MGKLSTKVFTENVYIYNSQQLIVQFSYQKVIFKHNSVIMNKALLYKIIKSATCKMLF